MIQYESSNVLDRMMHASHTRDCFLLLQQLGYRQFKIVDEQYLSEMTEPDPVMADVNVLCFPNTAIPASVQQYVRRNNPMKITLS